MLLTLEIIILMHTSNLGIFLQTIKKHDLAINDFKIACKINSTNFESFLFMADSYLEINQYVDAEKNYKISLSLNSNYINTYNNLGSAFKLQNKYDEARNIMEKGLEINPNHPVLNNNLGAVLCDLELYQEAEKYLIKATKLKDNYADAYANLGIAMKGNNKSKSALQILISFNKKFKSSNVLLLNTITGLLIEEKQFDNAIIFANKVLSIDKFNKNGMYNCGVALLI